MVNHMLCAVSQICVQPSQPRCPKALQIEHVIFPFNFLLHEQPTGFKLIVYVFTSFWWFRNHFNCLHSLNTYIRWTINSSNDWFNAWIGWFINIMGLAFWLVNCLVDWLPQVKQYMLIEWNASCWLKSVGEDFLWTWLVGQLIYALLIIGISCLLFLDIFVIGSFWYNDWTIISLKSNRPGPPTVAGPACCNMIDTSKTQNYKG